MHMCMYLCVSCICVYMKTKRIYTPTYLIVDDGILGAFLSFVLLCIFYTLQKSYVIHLNLAAGKKALVASLL